MNKFLSGKSQGARSLVIGLLLSLIPSFALATGGGPNPVPAPNPELKASCGFDIALVLDSSGSISTSELNQMKNAFKGFTEAFLPGTATLFSVTDFDTSAQVLQTFTGDLSLIHIAINTPVSGGNTNWADGLSKAQSTFDPRAGDEHPNLIVFASDGNPNRPTSATEALKQAIIKANEIKNSGTRILALGIGDNLNANNLKAISSVDAVYTSGFDTLASDLAELAQELCGGTITIKKLIDVDNNLSTKEDQLPAAGWTFEIDDASNTVSKVTGVDGFTESLEVNQGTYSVTEVLQSGFELKNAECLVNGSPAGSGTELGVTDISVDSNDIVSCVFINHENQAPVITLDGPNPHNILVGPDPYDDPGFGASDLEDGDLTSSIVVGGTVDTSTPGTYILTYNVSDLDGLAAVEKTRTVKVSAPPSECADQVDNDGDTLVDFPNDPGCTNEEDDDENTPPVITADSSITITLGGTFNPLNHATVNDDEDDPEPVLLIGGDTVLTGVVGDYNVTYNAVDTDGAAAQEKILIVKVRAVCSDTLDNDNDNVADEADPGCHTDADPNNTESYDPNDNDETNPADICTNLDGIQILVPQGLVSLNGDCVPPPSPICSDGLDNDEDGLIDATDPGCHTDNDPENSSSYDPNDNDETNQPPSPTLCEDSNANNLGQPLPCTYDSNDDNGGGGGGGGGGGNAPCSNSRDDDGDGLIDSADPGCHSDGNPNNPSSYVPSDNTENDVGQVLGATTIVDPNTCFYLRDYMRRDLNNDPHEVLKLQAFLINFDMRDNVALTGVFDDATFEAVSLFQLKYAEDILEPWGHVDPTGYVYILTLKKINEIYCQKIFPLNEAQVNEVAAFRALLESLRARGINPELPSYQDSVGRKDDDSTTTPVLGALGDESRGLGMVKGLAMAIVANPENMSDLTKSIYGLLVFVIALYVLGNVLKDVFYKNTPSNLRKRFITKWLVMDLGLATGIVASFIFGWWFILPLFALLVLSLVWTSLYPEHNSIRASVKSWYLVVAARLKSISRNAAESVKEVAKEPVKEPIVAKKEVLEKTPADKVIVMGPKK